MNLHSSTTGACTTTAHRESEFRIAEKLVDVPTGWGIERYLLVQRALDR